MVLVATNGAGRAPPQRRDFAAFQASLLVGTLADQTISVAIGWNVYEVTGRALDLGFVGLAQFLPTLALSLPGGHAADRLNRRRLVLCCQGILAVAAAVLCASPIGLRFYAVLSFMAAARTFLGPAQQALLPDVVAPGDLPRAVAFSSSLNELASVAGPALGGLLYGATGRASVVYGAAAVAYAFAALSTAFMTHRATHRTGSASLRTALEGLKYVSSDQALLGALSLDLFAVLLGSAVALLPIYARDVLHVGPSGLGVLRSAPAIGAGAIALALTRWPLRLPAGATLLTGVAVYGAATALFGASRSLWLSVAALMLVGAADMLSVVVRSSLTQLRTPEAMRGRVNAVALLLIGASSELGALESGLAAAWLGAVPAVVAGGLAACAIVGVYAVVFPGLRRLGLLEDASDTAFLHSGSKESA